MNSGDCKYIWQTSDWPDWRLDRTDPRQVMQE